MTLPGRCGNCSIRSQSHCGIALVWLGRMAKINVMQASDGFSARDLLAMVAIPLLFYAAIAPTLTWLEFDSGSENLVVAAALEMRRGSQWLMPTLQGELRITKPPLATWI